MTLCFLFVLLIFFNQFPELYFICLSHDLIATSTCKGPGIQTNEADVCAQVIINNDLPSCHDLSKKLLAIWGRPNDEKIGRNLISNLLVSCEPDFHDLFGFIGMDFPSKLRTDSQADRTSGNASRRALEAAKVSHLYSVLMKVL